MPMLALLEGWLRAMGRQQDADDVANWFEGGGEKKKEPPPEPSPEPEPIHTAKPVMNFGDEPERKARGGREGGGGGGAGGAGFEGGGGGGGGSAEAASAGGGGGGSSEASSRSRGGGGGEDAKEKERQQTGHQAESNGFKTLTPDQQHPGHLSGQHRDLDPAKPTAGIKSGYYRSQVERDGFKSASADAQDSAIRERAERFLERAGETPRHPALRDTSPEAHRARFNALGGDMPKWAKAKYPELTKESTHAASHSQDRAPSSAAPTPTRAPTSAGREM